MKRIFSFLLGGLLAGSAITAQAQQRLASEANTAEQRLVEDIGLDRLPTFFSSSVGDVRNTSVLLQNGISNTATIDQQSLSSPSNQAYIIQAGTANALGLIQTGGGNSAYMSQQGSNNRTDFTQNGQGNSSTITQKGSSNQLQGLIDGTNNQVNVLQNGNNNNIQSEIRQNDRVYNISQIGYGNTLTQKETTAQSPQGYNVEMRGAGINVTIEQGRVGR